MAHLVVHGRHAQHEQLQKTDTAAKKAYTAANKNRYISSEIDMAAQKTDTAITKTNSGLFSWEPPGVLGSPGPPGTQKPTQKLRNPVQQRKNWEQRLKSPIQRPKKPLQQLKN